MERHRPHGRTVITLEADVFCEFLLFKPIGFEGLIKKIQKFVNYERQTCMDNLCYFHTE